MRLLTKNLLIISLVKIALEVRIKLAIDCIAAIAQRPKIPKNIYFQINVHLVEEKLLKNLSNTRNYFLGTKEPL